MRTFIVTLEDYELQLKRELIVEAQGILESIYKAARIALPGEEITSSVKHKLPTMEQDDERTN